MDNNDVQLIGGPCGQHGPYTFYKAFKYSKNGVKRIVTLSEFFFVKLWIDSDLLCIGELQLLWIDKNSEQVLASLRLYFLPENTPEGRMDHGEDEVLAISEKVVIRVEDLITWITVDAEWAFGRLAKHHGDVRPPRILEEPAENNALRPVSLTESSLDFSDVEKERKILESCGLEKYGPSVMILSYPKYCRYRAMIKRLENVEDDFLKVKIVNALGGFTVSAKNTRILFCRDTFDYPELEGHELLCNHLAPKLKGRPRGKRKKRSVSPGSESNESEASASASTKQKTTDGIRCEPGTSSRRSTRSDNSEYKLFLKELNTFMKANHTPIGRIPSLGYKELDLHDFFVKVQKLGGYDCVTANRLWKSIFDEMSGHQNSTSAATVIRRHYERFLLPYERHIKGEEYKPLPTERRRLKSKNGSGTSDSENAEAPSTSLNQPASDEPSTSTDCKDSVNIKTEGKTSSSLRSVRVKPDRQKDKLNDKTKIHNNNSSNNNLNDMDMEVDHNSLSPDIKVEPNSLEIPIKSEFIKHEAMDKNAEPLTTAVAPVVQKISPEKSMSPIEGKETVPFIKTGDAGGSEVMEVPFKPKTPEVVDLDSEAYKAMNTTSINKPIMQDVKRRKLDILKEGGLEVTPVRGATASLTRDARPSVIQPTVSTIPIKSPIMPPPSINIVPTKRLQAPAKPKAASPTKTYQFANGTPPPKVVQSKSIYSYSEKTVYGNPKDFPIFPQQPQAASPALAPKFVGTNSRQTGGDILDLTVTSPQKPAIEMMRMPQMPSNSVYSRLADPKPPPKAPVLDGRRLGSNLEITLVAPGNKLPNQNRHSVNSIPPPSVQITPPANNHRYQPHKRMPNMEAYGNKLPRIEEPASKYSAKPSGAFLPVRDPKTGLEIPMHNPYVNKSPSIKADPINNHIKTMQSGAKSYQPPGVPAIQPYIAQLYEQKNHHYPLPYPMLDPYVFQHMYANNHQQQIMMSEQQMKVYMELMSQSRFQFPFPVSQDTNPNNFKKP